MSNLIVKRDQSLHDGYYIGGLTTRDLQLLHYIFEKVGGNPSGPRGRVDHLLSAIKDTRIEIDKSWLYSNCDRPDSVYIEEKRSGTCPKCFSKVSAEPAYNPEKGF